MKKFVAVLFLLLFSATVQGADKNSSNYPIKVHISASHMLLDPGKDDVTYANATLDGKKVELAGILLVHAQYSLIIPGDYYARLSKDTHNADSTAIHQEYEVLLPDGTVWHCVISSISE
ncbi:MAG: hypothetical protein WAN35_16065 [Terracidiphilus sp.]